MALFIVSVLCLYQMKKILLMILLLMLSACTGGSTETLENPILKLDKTDEEEIGSFIAKNYDDENDFSIGTGIIARICIDGGMTKLMVYHGDCGWTLQPKG